jgi:hypothetical protein
MEIVFAEVAEDPSQHKGHGLLMLSLFFNWLA